LVPEQVSRLLLPEQLRPEQLVSAQSMAESQSLSCVSLQLLSLVCPPAQHAPLLQVLPLAQVAEVPHRHAPAVQLSARLELQLVQVPPSAPQLLVEVPDEQLLPLQQPAQLVGSHTQLPDEQCWPVEQAPFVPHLQVPVAEQLSAVRVEQLVQLLALAPQAASVAGVMQLPLLQHPEAQLVASHTHEPAEQCWPTAHWAVPPHRQLPLALQASARTGSHTPQALPLVPHSARVGGVTQVPPLQHPLAQLPEPQPAHAWAVHALVPQEAQAAPPVPHWVCAVPARHWPVASQQPVAQLVASHTQAPPEQRCPTAHVAPLPQAQAPAVQRSDFESQAAHIAPAEPQLEAVWLPLAMQVLPEQQPPGQEVALHTQLPPEQVCPAPQAAPVPHLQAPLVQVLVLPEQGAQAAPPVPQLAALWLAPVMHTPALQQPVGQLVASQTQAAPEQR
jgi:hypothetical protein